MSSAIVKVSNWNQDRVDLVKRTVCPKGISNDEFALFIEQCKRSGLDPLLKEAFCVPRKKNIGSRDNPNWITAHEFQPSEAGMLVRAEDFPDFRGVSASAVYADDVIQIDAGVGAVSHVFSPTKKRGVLVGAWSLLLRDGKTPIVVWLDLVAYSQNTSTWSKMPATMIEKCARVAALRKAYPSAFDGLYTREEMEGREGFEASAEPSALPTLSEQAALPAHGKRVAEMKTQIAARATKTESPGLIPHDAEPPPDVKLPTISAPATSAGRTRKIPPIIEVEDGPPPLSDEDFRP